MSSLRFLASANIDRKLFGLSSMRCFQHSSLNRFGSGERKEFDGQDQGEGTE